MALIGEFTQNASGSHGRHPTVVSCGWSVDTDERGSFVTLSTYGSETRKKVGGVSQTIQLDREAARELVRVLRGAFPGL